MSKADNTRKRLIAAARKIALEHGAGSLTLDLVAEYAGVSKGGVLYHFGTKRALLEGLVVSFLDDFDLAVAKELKSGAESWLLAYIRASFPHRRAAQLRETGALFALLALEPDLLELARVRFQSWHEKAGGESEDPTSATLIRAAIDGLWYNEMFGFVLSAKEREELLARLEDLARARL